MSFLKKLFGKSTPAASAAPAAVPNVSIAQWRNPDWVIFSYPIRYGAESCSVEVDLSVTDGNRPAELVHCVRVLLPILPAKQNAQALPLDTAKAGILEAESTLLKFLTVNDCKGLLVGRLNYEGWQEWVLMLSDTASVQQAITDWTSKSPQPGLQVWESEGWEYFDEYVTPTPLDRINIAGERHIANLIAQGTNKEAKHWFWHTFEGPKAGLEALKTELLAQGYWAEIRSDGQLCAEKACLLQKSDIQAMTNYLYNTARQHDVTYTGWTSTMVSERWIGSEVKDGTGEFMFKNGALYRGDYKNGIRQGKGWIRFPDGSIYEGDWVENKRTGKGILRWNHKEVYEGGFKDNELHGQGEYRYASGNLYSGGWNNGVREGQGSFSWTNGDHYVGDWKADKRTGYGRYTYFKPIEWYEGEFLNGELTGEGYDFYEKQNRIRRARWNATKVEEELPMPPVAPDMLDWSPLDPAQYYRDNIVNHIEQAHAKGRIPCIYWRRPESPASHYLKHYHVLPVFAPIFQRISVLEIPYDTADLPYILGCDPKAMLIRIDPATKQFSKEILAPVWHTHRFEHAFNQLKYIIE